MKTTKIYFEFYKCTENTKHDSSVTCNPNENEINDFIDNTLFGFIPQYEMVDFSIRQG